MVSGSELETRALPDLTPEGPAGLDGEELGLHFSNHARERLQLRNIRLSTSDLVRLREGVDKAALRNAVLSLMIMDRLIFIVSIASRTVVTAVEGSRLKEKVFVGIDSAVIV
jgi:flagellar operon protein